MSASFGMRFFRDCSRQGRCGAEGNCRRSSRSAALDHRRFRAGGITSAYAIAKALNAEGITTPRGGKWDARKVINLLERLERKQ
jgi:hypothetical protein